MHVLLLCHIGEKTSSCVCITGTRQTNYKKTDTSLFSSNCRTEVAHSSLPSHYNSKISAHLCHDGLTALDLDIKGPREGRKSNGLPVPRRT